MYSENAPTPKTDLLEHLENFGQAGFCFGMSMGLAIASVYFRQLEIVLATAYISALVYSVLSFDNAPRIAFLRIAAITAGVLLGIRELLLLFWVPVMAVTFVVIAVAILAYLGYRHLQVALSQGEKR